MYSRTDKKEGTRIVQELLKNRKHKEQDELFNHDDMDLDISFLDSSPKGIENSILEIERKISENQQLLSNTIKDCKICQTTYMKGKIMGEYSKVQKKLEDALVLAKSKLKDKNIGDGGFTRDFGR